jgi:hypothetical protein
LQLRKGEWRAAKLVGSCIDYNAISPDRIRQTDAARIKAQCRSKY